MYLPSEVQQVALHVEGWKLNCGMDASDSTAGEFRESTEQDRDWKMATAGQKFRRAMEC
jgi:hypothetical protein